MAIRSGPDRFEAIVNAINEIRQESDIDVQVQRLDEEVIKELLSGPDADPTV